MIRAIHTGITSAASLATVLFALSVLALSFCALPVLFISLFWLG